MHNSLGEAIWKEESALYSLAYHKAKDKGPVHEIEGREEKIMS